jgi:glycosyltransferase involved in cell wall biosynthesis
VLHVLAGAEVGGTERQLLLLLPRLAAAVDTRLVIIRGGRLTAEFAAAVPTEVLAKRGKVDPVFLRRLVASIRRHQPDIVQTWGTTANVWGSLAAKLAGVEHLVVTEGSLDEWKGRIHRAVDARVYGWAAAVVCNSRVVADNLVRLGADASTVQVVPNGVVLPHVVAERPSSPRVVYLGRLNPVKGADVLVDALPAVVHAVPEVRCVIAGPAAQPVEIAFAERLRRRVEELGLEDVASMPGPTPDPFPLLATASVVVVPSRSEGSPNVVFEAMAAGAPVVAAAVGGIPEIVIDGVTGSLVPAEDPERLAAAVVACLRDPGPAAERARRARETMQTRYDIDVVSRQWEGLYAGLLDASDEVLDEGVVA